MRTVVLVVAVILGVAGTAEAGISTGDDILHIRDLPPDDNGYEGFQLGYVYSYWGLFEVDLWHTDGDFVLYRGDFFLRIGDEQLAKYGGASVPWKYRIPLGWILIVGLIELALVTQGRRKIGVVFGLAGGMTVIALVFYLIGLRPEYLIPLALAGHHVVASMLALRMQRQLEEAEGPSRRSLLDEDPPEREREYERDILPPPPRVETDPFRAPPAPRPIITERPPERPSTAPIAHDPNAEQPKLLR